MATLLLYQVFAKVFLLRSLSCLAPILPLFFHIDSAVEGSGSLAAVAYVAVSLIASDEESSV